MKRLLYILSMLPLCLSAQNMYNVSSIFENDLNGTARYIGMGGSMSALGADLSTMGTNPAGMAMYRRNDFSLTAGVNINTSKADYEGEITKSNDVNAFLGNASMVISLERDKDWLKFINIGLGYRRNNNLAGEFDMCAASNGFSQQFVMRQLYDSRRFKYNELSSDLYTDYRASWLPLLAADAWLCDESGDNFLTYPGDTILVWHPKELAYNEETRGGVHVVDFNVSANIKDRIYLGATLGVSSVDYSRYTSYSEYDDYKYAAIYTLENNMMLKGSGYNLKLGAIIRPFKYSPFRIGVSVHTPTWYSLKQYTWAVITDPWSNRFSTVDADRFGSELLVKSKLRTPWRFNASMAYTFGTYLALNAEYEYADYSKSKFTNHGSVNDAQNEEIRYNMTEQHTARVGAELNVEGFAVRVGYNYSTAPFKTEAYKELMSASVAETSTEYMNRYEKDVVTCGIGFSGKTFYFDMAYKLEMQKADFYPFYDAEVPNPGAKVNLINHSAMATLGMRF